MLNVGILMETSVAACIVCRVTS